MLNDTIFAPATPPGRSGVAVIRISGTAVKDVLKPLGISVSLVPRQARLVQLRDGINGEVMDAALALYFPAPRSFTGEDVLELHTHGSIAVQRAILEKLSTLSGVRMAEPGEFTRRAVLNGKMDVTAAEGLADLIYAQTAPDAG